jgi:hypothetical protein
MVALQLSNHVTGLFTVTVNELFPPQIIVDSSAEKLENRSAPNRLYQELPKITGSYGNEAKERSCQIASTPKGGTDSVTYLQYAQHLTRETQSSASEPIALLTDDCPGHKSLDVLEHFVDHSAHVMLGSPNLTHVGQVLDGAFGTLKHNTCEGVKLIQDANIDAETGMPKALTVADIGKLLDKPPGWTGPAGPLLDTFTKKNINSAWRRVSPHNSKQC